MSHFTTETYRAKREVINFSKTLAPDDNRTEQRFVSDMIYGLLRSGSVTLKDIGAALNEDIRIINTIDRLSQHLSKPLSKQIAMNYTKRMMSKLDHDPIFLVDDSEIIKPYGKAFEALGRVRDGSDPKHDIKPGYMVTEIVGLTKREKQPVSFYSQIHSSAEEGYVSANQVLYEGLNSVLSHIRADQRPTFIFDRGYDANDLFQFMYNHEKKPYYIIRLTQKRKLKVGKHWISAPDLAAARKGKIRTELTFWDASHSRMINQTVYISHLKTRITAGGFPVFLVLVYGLSDTPMMLATNRPIYNKLDVQKIVWHYMSRWRIEEYFRFKKQHFDFENIRVRSLQSLNNLNQLLGYAIALVGILADKKSYSAFTGRLIVNAKALRENISFFYYQIALGLMNTLAYAREGIDRWFKRRREPQRQLSFLHIV